MTLASSYLLNVCVLYKVPCDGLMSHPLHNPTLLPVFPGIVLNPLPSYDYLLKMNEIFLKWQTMHTTHTKPHGNAVCCAP